MILLFPVLICASLSRFQDIDRCLVTVLKIDKGVYFLQSRYPIIEAYAQPGQRCWIIDQSHDGRKIVVHFMDWESGDFFFLEMMVNRFRKTVKVKVTR